MTGDKGTKPPGVSRAVPGLRIEISTHDRDFTQDYVSGAASHFGFVSLPHFLGSSLCIFSIAFAVSGCFSITCFVMVWTISSHEPAESFCSQGPPNDLHVIVFIFHLHHTDRMHPQSWGVVEPIAKRLPQELCVRCGKVARTCSPDPRQDSTRIPGAGRAWDPSRVPSFWQCFGSDECAHDRLVALWPQ